jgi:hypothetical protein
MADNRKAEIPISFPTKQAEKDLKQTEGLFRKTFSSLKNIEERTGIFSTIGTAGTSLIGNVFQPVTQSGASSALGATGGAIQTGLAGLGTALGGTSGFLIGNVIGEAFSKLAQSIGEEIRAVQDRSLGEVQSIVETFAQNGVDLNEKLISELLKQSEERNKRAFDAIKKVKEIQDRQTDKTGIIINATKRRIHDTLGL